MFTTHVKAHAEQVSFQVVVVAVTRQQFFLIAGLLTVICNPGLAAVLAPDRADILYHAYDGGGVEVNGPSILVRKSIGNSVSAFGNYYVDNVSSASIDVVTQSGASAYTEERTEYSVGGEYLHDKTTMSLAYTSSSESDYEAETASFNISMDMFGDLTTVTLGYALGSDIVRSNADLTFEDTIDRRNYRVNVSQVLSKNSILGFIFETITDEGFLNNPYRSYRYLDSGSSNGYSWAPEVYPRTRTSNAAALRLRYFLPYRAAVYGGYRYFDDDWDIKADTFDIGYVHPFRENWLFDINFRHYSQNSAFFYKDLFNAADEFIYLGRDKELSTFTSQTLGLGVTYEFTKNNWQYIDRGTLNLYYDTIFFDYEDFSDLTQTGYPVGQEPAYSFTANILRLFVSIWY
jgi:hypothetical protein